MYSMPFYLFRELILKNADLWGGNRIRFLYNGNKGGVICWFYFIFYCLLINLSRFIKLE